MKFLNKAVKVLGLSLLLSSFAIKDVSAATVTTSVDWFNKTGTFATDLSYGLNAYQYTDPNTVGLQGNSNYRTNLAYMKAGFIRLHNLDQMKDSTTNRLGWIINPTTSAYQWDEAKITASLTGTYTNSTLLINIANWNTFLSDANGDLRVDAYDQYAALCADLVRIINVKLGKNIKYWEVTNELDGRYSGRMAELGKIFNKAYDAMKAVDPTIKIGGAAYANAYSSTNFRDYITATKDRIDFVSYHTYNGSSATTTKQTIFNGAEGLGYPTGLVRGIINQVVPARASQIELFHNEFNMARTAYSATWLTDSTSTIYDALALRSFVLAGTTGANAWNEGDGWWGKLNNNATWDKRPAAHLYKILNERAKGEVVNTVSSDPKLLQSYAVQDANGKESIVVINRSEADQTFKLVSSNWDARPSWSTYVYAYQALPSGYAQYQTNHNALSVDGVTIPANSVVVFRYLN